MAKWLERQVLDIPYFCLCLSRRAFVSACKHIGRKPPKHWVGKHCNATCWTFTKNSRPYDPPVCIVCLDDKKPRALSAIVGILAHEARHVYDAASGQNSGIQWHEEELESTFLQLITERLVEDYLRQIGAPDRLPRKRKGVTKCHSSKRRQKAHKPPESETTGKTLPDRGKA